MKKTYESPKAEKMKFDYSDAVVASSIIKCGNETTYKDSNDDDEYCQGQIINHVVKDV